MSKSKSAIDMSRPLALYALTLGLLMLLALLVSNVPPLSLSYHLELPARKAVCLTSLAIGAVAGVLALAKHQERVAQPWRVHQALVSSLYIVFVGFSVFGVLTLR